MSMALNSVGNKGRTRVRRGLMDQTGIRSHQINKAVKTIRAGGGRLQYALEARAGETNISMFGLKVTWREGSAMGQIRMLQTVSAAPWNTRRVFPGVFSIPKYGNRVFKRGGPGRFPLKAVHGPNLALEIVKAQSRTGFDITAPKVGEEVGRLLGLAVSGSRSSALRRVSRYSDARSVGSDPPCIAACLIFGQLGLVVCGAP